MRKILIFNIFLVLIACNKENKFESSKSGLQYHFVIENKNGVKPQLNDVIEANVKIFSGDSLIFNSEDVSQEYRILLKKLPNGQIYEALSMMHLGDSAIFKINATDFYEKSANLPLPQQIKKDELLLFQIRVDNILTPEQVEIEHQRIYKINIKNEQQVLYEYMKQSNINAKINDSGIYLILRNVGFGAFPKTNDTVTVSYDLTIVNKRDFGMPLVKDKNYVFVVGDTTTIPGLSIAVKLLKKGAKALVIIPSPLAYGEKGIQDLIAPYSTLLFELKLVDIKRKK